MAFVVTPLATNDMGGQPRSRRMRAILTLAALLGAALAGCIGEPAADLDAAAADDMAGHADLYQLPAIVSAVEHVTQAADVSTGAGIWIDGHHAFVSARGDGLFVVDLMDPESPTVIAHVSAVDGLGDPMYARDADVIHVPVTLEDGTVEDRAILGLSGANQGIHFLDVTNAHEPRYITTILEELEVGSHNLAMHPTLPYVYNSASNGEGGTIDIIDVSDPDAPVVVTTFGDLGCHDITFLVTEEKQRLYCPGIARTQIWDIADPTAGVLISEITMDPLPTRGGGAVNLDPMQSFGQGLHHSAYATHDGDLLIIGDEFMGGGGPGCQANAAGVVSSPTGALWFVDTSDEVNWELLGWFSPEFPANNAPSPNPSNPGPGMVLSALPNCTSHFGQLIPGEDKIVMGWYTAGVILLDFSDPTSPQMLSQWNQGTNTWDARLYHGYALTGDIARGLDVFKLVG